MMSPTHAPLPFETREREGAACRKRLPLILAGVGVVVAIVGLAVVLKPGTNKAHAGVHKAARVKEAPPAPRAAVVVKREERTTTTTPTTTATSTNTATDTDTQMEAEHEEHKNHSHKKAHKNTTHHDHKHKDCAGGPAAACECLLRCEVFSSAPEHCSGRDHRGKRELVNKLIKSTMLNHSNMCEGMRCIRDCAESLGCMDSKVREDCDIVEKNYDMHRGHSDPPCELHCGKEREEDEAEEQEEEEEEGESKAKRDEKEMKTEKSESESETETVTE
eukprot:CAMPEP_0168383176 /NCGR_PEP_ID=MMETSP0228-20121227/13770_1 /TAXON_ID=133427 /ORGANISM="Protoceratium reticulatum, Strain CCCM 535 (=CCMP 1889)" /LENGTH=275 /DNA_ID=CAMNT_0008396323 /DNA_START=29 /DNA_END=856 /DNA_ORIENTATION=+